MNIIDSIPKTLILLLNPIFKVNTLRLNIEIYIQAYCRLLELGLEHRKAPNTFVLEAF